MRPSRITAPMALVRYNDPMLDLALLQSFLAVYRHGSITQAAQSLHLSQPAVSLHIRTLETQLQHSLFTRSSRGVLPTPEAHDLASATSSHLDALAQISSQLQGKASELAGDIQMGGPADLMATKVLPALASLPEQGVRIKVTLGLAHDLLHRLALGDLDVVIATQRAAMRGLEYQHLFDEELVLVANPAWAERLPESAIRQRGADALAGAPLVAFAEDLPIVRRYYRTVFGTKPAARAAIIVEDLRAVMAAVSAGAGISVLPGYLCEDMLNRGDLVPLWRPEHPPRNALYLATKAGTGTQPRTALVQRLLKQAAPHWRG